MELVQWDFFFTTFRSKALLRGRTIEEFWATRFYSFSMKLPPDLELALALDHAQGVRPRPFGIGTSQSGVFEVQNERGVYLHQKGLRNLARCSPRRILFYAWDELERAYEDGDPVLLAATSWITDNPGPSLHKHTRLAA